MPPIQDVHIDQALSNFAVGVLEDGERVAGGFFPVTEVDALSNKYFVLDRQAFVRGDARPRDPMQESAGTDFTLSNDNYNCVPYAMHADMDQMKLANADNPRMYEEGATRVATENLLLSLEVIWASRFFTTGIWGTDVVGNTNFPQWSNKAGSDPIADIETGKRTVLVNGGKKANALLCGYDVWYALKNHPLFVDRVKHTSSDAVTAAIIARLLELDKIVVASAVKATNAPGATEAYDFVFGKHALLAYVGKSGEGEFMASAGRIFAWKGMNPGVFGAETATVKRLEMPLKKAVRFETETALDYKTSGSKLGYFFSGASA